MELDRKQTHWLVIVVVRLWYWNQIRLEISGEQEWDFCYDRQWHTWIVLYLPVPNFWRVYGHSSGSMRLYLCTVVLWHQHANKLTTSTTPTCWYLTPIWITMFTISVTAEGDGNVISLQVFSYTKILDKFEFEPHGGDRRKHRGSPKFSQFILSGTWMSVPNFTAIHSIVVEIFQSGQKWWDQNRAMPLARLKNLSSFSSAHMCYKEQYEPSRQWWTALYANTSVAHEAISIHKGRSPLIGFPGQMLARLTKIASYITHWFWFVLSRATKYSKMRLVYTKDCQ